MKTALETLNKYIDFSLDGTKDTKVPYMKGL